MSIPFWIYISIFALVFALCVPAGILSFVLMHKTYGGRKALVLIFTIAFFVLYGIAIICMSLDDSDAIYFMLLCFPFPIVSMILILTRPKVSNNVSNRNNKSTNYLDDLAKLKALLDNGAITKEEYDKKKNELLGN